MSSANQEEGQGCWRKSLWCICTCGGKRIFRVSPSDPIPTVDAGATPNARNEQIAQARAAAEKNLRTIQSESGHSNGHINHFFVSDENTGENTPSSSNGQRRNIILSSGDDDVHLQNSIFIEVGKDRKIRVVHLKQEEISESPEPHSPDDHVDNSNASGTSASPSKNAAATADGTKPGEEEEDEYWFSKWTRKPRFRSIFEKNTIHGGGSGDEDEVGGGAGDNGSPNTLSKDFEVARAAAAAKRRAWAYNNGNSPGVENKTVGKVVEDQEDDGNSIDISDIYGQRWTKGGNGKETPGDEATHTTTTGGEGSSPDGAEVGVATIQVEVQSHPLNSSGGDDSKGFTNLGFEEDDDDVGGGGVKTEPESGSATKGSFLKEIAPTASSPNANVGKVESASGNGNESKRVPKLPLLLFLHGIASSSDVWKSQIDFFHSLGYEIIAPDLIGHGFSSSPSNVKYYFFESIAQDLLSVYDHFVQEGRKVVVIGHGYGACLASVIARVRPKSVCVLVSIAGGGPTPLVSRTCCRSSLIPFYCKLFHKNKKKGRFDNPDLKNILPPQVHENILTGQVWSDGDSAFYRRIIVPTLLVYGMKDKVVNLVEQCEMERTIPKSFLEIIDKSGHMVMFDEPVKLNKMLAKFIQSWS